MLDKLWFSEGLERLRDLIQNSYWIVGGDFNIIRYLYEKHGGIKHLKGNIIGFNNLITNTHLIDIENINGVFTQSKRSVL